MKISIVTVSYNAAETIEATIKSVVSQTYNNIEYIIMDGGSNDGTQSIIKKYADNISYWVSKPDNGIYDAMNMGIDKCTGDYVYFIGADDCLVNKDIIEKVVESMVDSPDILSGPVYLVYGKMQRLFNYYSRNISDGNLLDILLPPHQGLFVKTKIMKQLKFDVKYKIRADFKLELILLADIKYKFKEIAEPIAFYSVEGTSNVLTDVMRIESERILKELDLWKIDNKNKSRLLQWVKRSIKAFLIRIKMWEFLLFLRGWEKLRCNW